MSVSCLCPGPELGAEGVSVCCVCTFIFSFLCECHIRFSALAVSGSFISFPWIGGLTLTLIGISWWTAVHVVPVNSTSCLLFHKLVWIIGSVDLFTCQKLLHDFEETQQSAQKPSHQRQAVRHRRQVGNISANYEPTDGTYFTGTLFISLTGQYITFPNTPAENVVVMRVSTPSQANMTGAREQQNHKDLRILHK